MVSEAAAITGQDFYFLGPRNQTQLSEPAAREGTRTSAARAAVTGEMESAALLVADLSDPLEFDAEDALKSWLLAAEESVGGASETAAQGERTLVKLNHRVLAICGVGGVAGVAGYLLSASTGSAWLGVSQFMWASIAVAALGFGVEVAIVQMLHRLRQWAN